MTEAERDRAEKAAEEYSGCTEYTDRGEQPYLLKQAYLAGYEQALKDAETNPNIIPIDILDRLHRIVDKLTAAEMAIKNR